MLLRFAIFLVGVVHSLCWILRALLFLSTSLFILIVQPYKKHYMDVLDALLLALLGFLILLVVTLKFVLPSANETLPLIFVVACGVPQLALLLSVMSRSGCLSNAEYCNVLYTQLNATVTITVAVTDINLCCSKHHTVFT